MYLVQNDWNECRDYDVTSNESPLREVWRDKFARNLPFTSFSRPFPGSGITPTIQGIFFMFVALYNKKREKKKREEKEKKEEEEEKREEEKRGEKIHKFKP